jgi:GAF domain-containing protein
MSSAQVRADGTREASERDVGVELLVEAGVVLAESLDLERTLGQVARLTVPRLADLCVIDLRLEDGAIRRMAVASVDDEVARKLESLRERGQLDPAGEHPVARVIRSGEAELLAQLSDDQLHSFAEGAEHARFMLDHGYKAAVVAPLLARQRTLGALSVTDAHTRGRTWTWCASSRAALPSRSTTPGCLPTRCG